LRSKYIEETGFLSANYSQGEVEVQATFTNRTYLSSLYQLMGMYPNDYPQIQDYAYFGIGSGDDSSYLSEIQLEAALNSSSREESEFNVTWRN
jgi:hypothetical protein